MTLSKRCQSAGLSGGAELSRITGTSKETLTNWMKNKPKLFEVVLLGAVQTIDDSVRLKKTICYEMQPVHIANCYDINRYQP